jgi:hypothetical protein
MVLAKRLVKVTFTCIVDRKEHASMRQIAAKVRNTDLIRQANLDPKETCANARATAESNLRYQISQITHKLTSSPQVHLGMGKTCGKKDNTHNIKVFVE